MTSINQNNNSVINNDFFLKNGYEIERFIETTPMLISQLRLALREVKNLQFRDIGYRQACELISNEIGIISQARSKINITNQEKNFSKETGIINNSSLIFDLVCLTDENLNKRLKVIYELNLIKIKHFLCKNENLSENTRNQITTLFPRDGIRQRLKVASLKMIPELIREINKISEKCMAIKKYGKKYNKSFISKKMGFRVSRISELVAYNPQASTRFIKREEIKAIRKFISYKLPDDLYEFPLLFDIKLLKSELNSDIESSNNEISYPISSIEWNSSNQNILPASFQPLSPSLQPLPENQWIPPSQGDYYSLELDNVLRAPEDFPNQNILPPSFQPLPSSLQPLPENQWIPPSQGDYYSLELDNVLRAPEDFPNQNILPPSFQPLPSSLQPLPENQWIPPSQGDYYSLELEENNALYPSSQASQKPLEDLRQNPSSLQPPTTSQNQLHHFSRQNPLHLQPPGTQANQSDSWDSFSLGNAFSPTSLQKISQKPLEDLRQNPSSLQPPTTSQNQLHHFSRQNPLHLQPPGTQTNQSDSWDSFSLGNAFSPTSLQKISQKPISQKPLEDLHQNPLSSYPQTTTESQWPDSYPLNQNVLYPLSQATNQNQSNLISLDPQPQPDRQEINRASRMVLKFEMLQELKKGIDEFQKDHEEIPMSTINRMIGFQHQSELGIYINKAESSSSNIVKYNARPATISKDYLQKIRQFLFDYIPNSWKRFPALFNHEILPLPLDMAKHIRENVHHQDIIEKESQNQVKQTSVNSHNKKPRKNKQLEKPAKHPPQNRYKIVTDKDNNGNAFSKYYNLAYKPKIINYQEPKQKKN